MFSQYFACKPRCSRLLRRAAAGRSMHVQYGCTYARAAERRAVARPRLARDRNSAAQPPRSSQHRMTHQTRTFAHNGVSYNAAPIDTSSVRMERSSDFPLSMPHISRSTTVRCIITHTIRREHSATHQTPATACARYATLRRLEIDRSTGPRANGHEAAARQRRSRPARGFDRV